VSLLSIGFALIVVVVMPLRAWLRLSRKSPAPSPFITIVETVTLIIVLLFLLRYEGVSVAAVGLARTTVDQFLISAAISTAVIVGLDLLALLLSRSAALRTEDEHGAAVRKQITTNSLPQGKELLGFVPVVLITAIWEELCFRGVALYLAPPTVFGTVSIIALSSTLFALHHLRRGITAAAYSGFYGVLFSLLYLGVGSLPPVIFAHAFGNLFVALYTGPRLLAAGHSRSSLSTKTERLNKIEWS